VLQDKGVPATSALVQACALMNHLAISRRTDRAVIAHINATMLLAPTRYRVLAVTPGGSNRFA